MRPATLFAPLIFLLLLAAACNPKKKEEQAAAELHIPPAIEVPGYFLEKKISVAEARAFEKKFGAIAATAPEKQGLVYNRMGEDNLPFEVNYTIKNDSIEKVIYTWSHLPGEKDGMELQLMILQKLMDKRTGKAGGYTPDENRADEAMSTRIVFYDSYSWSHYTPGGQGYSAFIYFKDSGRAGQSFFNFTIQFD